jgi:hypothetical protein
VLVCSDLVCKGVRRPELAPGLELVYWHGCVTCCCGVEQRSLAAELPVDSDQSLKQGQS